jgi:hypothetical protein
MDSLARFIVLRFGRVPGPGVPSWLPSCILNFEPRFPPEVLRELFEVSVFCKWVC